MLKGQFQNFLINRICQIPLMFLQGDVAFVFQARDLAVRLDRSMEIECCAGLEIITAAVAHLAIR